MVSSKRLLPLLLFLVVLEACKVASPTEEKNYLFSIDDSLVSSDEFTYIYRKNNASSDSAFTKKDIRAYLDLFINFKLKVKEAESLGLDTAQSFVDEYNSYLDQLAEPYLSENEVTEQLVMEAYERLKEEVNVSHILIRVGSQAPPPDTLKAYNKALEIWQEANTNTDFASLASTYSDEPNASSTKGHLGYFTTFQMVYPFESAAFNTPVGKVSKPIRTQFGYHLVKVNDRRPSRGKVQVAHIMIRTNAEGAAEDSLLSRNKIFEIHEMLMADADWTEVCNQYSEDLNTRTKAGLLPEFGPGRMIKSFEEAAFSLERPDEISDPFQTPFGWHIVKLEKKTGLEEFEVIESELRKAISRNPRSQLSRKKLISRLKRENGYQFNQDLLSEVVNNADSSLIKGTWKYDGALESMQQELFRIGSLPFELSSFFSHVTKNSRQVSYSPQFYMQQLYDQFVEVKLIEIEKENLDDKYVDYRMLKQEYREGILLFQLMEDKVWNKASTDTLGLAQFFQENQANYQWQQRAEATIFTASNGVIEEIKAEYGKDFSSFFTADSSYQALKKELETKYNAQSALTLQVEKGLFEDGQNSRLNQVKWEVGVFETSENASRNLIVINSVLAPAPKELSEIRGTVISDYQKKLEADWVAELKAKYQIDLDEKELNHVYEILDKE